MRHTRYTQYHDGISLLPVFAEHLVTHTTFIS